MQKINIGLLSHKNEEELNLLEGLVMKVTLHWHITPILKKNTLE